MRIAPAIVIAATWPSPALPLRPEIDWSKVDQAIGRSGRRCRATCIATASRAPICT